MNTRLARLRALLLLLLLLHAPFARAWIDAPEGATRLTFANPVVKQDAADPWAVWHDGFYYFLFTQGGQISIWKSASLTTLDSAQKAVVWRPKADNPFRWNIWAPELHLISGKWFIYYAADDRADKHHRMFALEAETGDPMGSYIERGMLNVAGEEGERWAIDGTILQRGGRLYLIWSGWAGDGSAGKEDQNLYIAAMKNPWTLDGPRVLLSRPQLRWEWKINEGPEVLEHDGRLWIVYSGNGAWTPRYVLGALEFQGGAGGDVLDAASWKKNPLPILRSYRSEQGSVFGPGHCAFTRSPDGRETWMVFHARSVDGDGWPGRKCYAQKVEWDSAGEPYLDRPAVAGEQRTVPSGDAPVVGMLAR